MGACLLGSSLDQELDGVDEPFDSDDMADGDDEEDEEVDLM